MGVIYRAQDTRLGRTVAIKVIAAEHARDAGFRRRFVQEARLAAGVTHPHVVPILDARDDHGLLYIVMPFIDGYDLSLPLRHGSVPERATLLRHAVQVAGALTVAHEAGVIHRDLKPANLMIPDAAPQHAYLMDFGLAERQIDAARRARGNFEGTVDYMAPEQAGGEPAEPRADVYALACLLFHCLTGVRPFPEATDELIVEAHRSACRPKLSASDPGLEPADAILARGMAIDPQARPVSALELAVAVQAALAESDDETVARPPDPPPADPSHRTKV